MLFAVCCDDDYKNVICLNRFINICCAAAVEDEESSSSNHYNHIAKASGGR